jgi:outer membrane receptor protein involved in Fe transport
MIVKLQAKTRGVLVIALALMSAPAFAQVDPFAGDPGMDDSAPPETPPQTAPEEPEPGETPPPTDAPVDDAAEDPAAPPAEESAEAEASAEASASVDASSAVAAIDAGEPPPADAAAATPPLVLMTGSHIRRPRLIVDGAMIIDTPLRTEVQGREYLQIRRQLGGAALPDTTAALGLGGAGTARLELRLQPTLVLLNGRRLVTAPFVGPGGSDYVDINQIPLQLIDRVETTYGLAAGLYGESAMGGVINFVTKRDYDGFEVEVGGQATDQFDQGEAEIAIVAGIGSEKTGMTSMVSYFHREPLAATDRDWIGERGERIESLQGSPGAFQQITNFDYPIADPLCELAETFGHSRGYETRLRGYGVPGNLSQIQFTQPELFDQFIMNQDVARGPNPSALDLSGRNYPADMPGVIEPLETSTFCAGNFTGNNDLILKEQRLQTYNTFWHKLSDHTEAFAELGYYRTENENRTAPAFPIIRIAPDINDPQPLWVPVDHADQPVEAYGFAAAEATGAARIPNYLFLAGRTQGPFNGDGINERRVDVWRGVLGLQGDLGGIAPNSPIGSWSWSVAGTYSSSELLSRVNDTLMSNLSEALAACSAENEFDVPTTIKQRQEKGCFNPFYSSVLNNAAIDPLNVSSQSAANSRGFITTDSESPGQDGFGAQDGGYICDPVLDPNAPGCAALDPRGDGSFTYAGTPNTKQVIDHITGQHYQVQKRTLAMVDSSIGGDIAEFGGGGLGFGLGGQFRRETLLIDYDQAYNDYDYAFLFGANDLEPVSRSVLAAHAELRLRLADGLIELQPAARVELYEVVGAAVSPQVGLAIRPFATMGKTPVEWLLLRGNVGRGQQAPTLTQLYGQQNDFVQVDYRGTTHFIAHQISGNEDLEFENYTTISGGLQWDWVGIHLGADFWTTKIDNVITSDNTRTIVQDCWAQFNSPMGGGECTELKFLAGTETLDHVETRYENIAEVDTNGLDGTLSYTLDSKRRGMGDFGTFVLAVQGTYINSYLISSPRALTHYYRDGTASLAPGEYVAPSFNGDKTRDYSGLTAEYEAAGYRNLDNFAPPIPRLRFNVPVRWMFGGHTVGATMRYIDGYNDDSEYTIERQNLPGVDRIFQAEGEAIPSWMVFDLMYSLQIGDESWKTTFTVGVINLLGEEPPAVESPLGYEVGLHDPRGRALYARVAGEF